MKTFQWRTREETLGKRDSRHRHSTEELRKHSETLGKGDSRQSHSTEELDRRGRQRSPAETLGRLSGEAVKDLLGTLAKNFSEEFIRIGRSLGKQFSKLGKR